VAAGGGYRRPNTHYDGGPDDVNRGTWNGGGAWHLAVGWLVPSPLLLITGRP